MLCKLLDKTAAELGVVLTDEEIRPGDLYLAARNSGAFLLTCREVKQGYIVPVEMAYCYDIHECRKVAEVPDVS